MNDILHQDAQKFSEFLLEHYEPARQWEDPVGYCAWNIAHGFIAAVVDQDGTILAMGAARPVDRPGFGVLPFYFNTNGSCLHIDLLIDKTDDPWATKSLRDFCELRFGPRKTVTMFRHAEEALRVYPYARFWQKILSIKKRKTKKDSKQYGTTIRTRAGQSTQAA